MSKNSYLWNVEYSSCSGIQKLPCFYIFYICINAYFLLFLRSCFLSSRQNLIWKIKKRKSTKLLKKFYSFNLSSITHFYQFACKCLIHFEISFSDFAANFGTELFEYLQKKKVISFLRN